MEKKILKIIEEKINPKLLEHQGWIDFEKIENNILYIRFRGACSGCGANVETVNTIIKPAIQKEIKEIKDVKIVEEVSEELIDIARKLLSKN